MRQYLVLCAGGLEDEVACCLRESFDLRSVQSLRDVSTAVPSGEAGVGKLLVTTDKAPERLIHEARCTQAWFAFLAAMDNVDSSPPAEAALQRVASAVSQPEGWTPAVETWRLVARGAAEEEEGDDAITFRCSCIRDGTHPFRSPEVTQYAGAAILNSRAAAKQKYAVDLKKYMMEICIFISDKQLVSGISLSSNVTCKNGLRSEQRAPFVPCPSRLAVLRPSTAHVLLRLARVKPGDVVLDSFAGVGTIPIEASHAFCAFGLCGDLEAPAIDAMQANLRSADAAAAPPSQQRLPGGPQRGPADGCQMDATHLPLCTASVDVVVVDAPFGKACGSLKQTQRIFPPAMREMARVLRPGGRAVLLVLSPSLVQQQLRPRGAPGGGEVPMVWREERPAIRVNIGGLLAYVFVLVRTDVAAPPPKAKKVRTGSRGKKRKEGGHVQGEADSRAAAAEAEALAVDA